MVWEISNIKDIIGFAGDSIVYILMFSMIYIEFISIAVKKTRKITFKSILIYISILLICAIFGFASDNSGTAMRHRLNLLPMLLYLFMICNSTQRLCDKYLGFIVED